MLPSNCCVHSCSKWHRCNALNISAEVMGPCVPAGIWPGIYCTLPTGDYMSGTCMAWADSLEQPPVVTELDNITSVKQQNGKVCPKSRRFGDGEWRMCWLNSQQLVVLLQPQCKRAGWSGASSWSGCRSEIWAPRVRLPLHHRANIGAGDASRVLWAEAGAGTPKPAGHQFLLCAQGLDYTKNKFSSFLIRNVGVLPISKILNIAQLDMYFLYLCICCIIPGRQALSWAYGV